MAGQGGLPGRPATELARGSRRTRERRDRAGLSRRRAASEDVADPDGSALSAQRRLKRRIGEQAARALDVDLFPLGKFEGDMAIHIERGQFVCAANGEALGSVVRIGGDSFLVESSARPAALVCSVADIEDVRNGGIRLSRMRDQLHCAGSATLLTEQT